MRARPRVDANHHEIVRALRQAGIQVQDLSAVGNGCPDILAGRNGVNVLLEIKDGTKTAGNRPLTAAQVEWHERWPGQVAVVTSVDEAVNAVLRACGLLPNPELVASAGLGQLAAR